MQKEMKNIISKNELNIIHKKLFNLNIKKWTFIKKHTFYNWIKKQDQIEVIKEFYYSYDNFKEMLNYYIQILNYRHGLNFYINQISNKEIEIEIIWHTNFNKNEFKINLFKNCSECKNKAEFYIHYLNINLKYYFCKFHKRTLYKKNTAKLYKLENGRWNNVKF